VVKRMRERGVRHILVVDGAGRLVGVVSVRDLV
jgi:CBS domain.